MTLLVYLLIASNHLIKGHIWEFKFSRCVYLEIAIMSYMTLLVYRVKQNLGKQVLRIPCPKFRSPSSSFVVFIHGQRDLSSLPWIGGAAVQISWKIGGCWGAVAISLKKLNLMCYILRTCLPRFCLTLYSNIKLKRWHLSTKCEVFQFKILGCDIITCCVHPPPEFENVKRIASILLVYRVWPLNDLMRPKCPQTPILSSLTEAED